MSTVYLVLSLFESSLLYKEAIKEKIQKKKKEKIQLNTNKTEKVIYFVNSKCCEYSDRGEQGLIVNFHPVVVESC